MAQSLFKELKKAHEDAFLCVYAPAFMMPVLKRMPEVDDTITNPFSHGEFNLPLRYQEGRKLKKHNFDKAYILPNSFKSALVPFFAGIKERIGFIGESRFLVLNRVRKDKKAFPMMVQRYAALAHLQCKNAGGLPSFDYPSLEVKKPARKLLERLSLSTDRPFLVLGCGANYGPAKLWPAEYFAKVSSCWIEEYEGAVLGAGTKNDAPTVSEIKSYLPDSHKPYFYDIAGKTSIDEALDLIGICKAAICNDSGMMHTVAAVNIPQVCIFGSTSTNYTPPLSNRAVCLESQEPCHPCFARTCKFGTYACLKGITPQMVMQKLKALLSS